MTENQWFEFSDKIAIISIMLNLIEINIEFIHLKI